jgi:ribose 5-phosphate isomerase RpiB
MAAQPLPIPLEKPTPVALAKENSFFELDSELDALLERIEDEIEEHGEASAEAMDALSLFAKAMNVKIDRIGTYLTAMEVRAAHCKAQMQRFATRAKHAENKIALTKRMVLEYLAIHELKKIESDEFTLRRQKNSVDSVIISNPETIPPDLRTYELKVDGSFWLSLINEVSEPYAETLLRCVRSEEPSNSAIKAFVGTGGRVEGAIVRRDFHLRVE